MAEQLQLARPQRRNDSMKPLLLLLFASAALSQPTGSANVTGSCNSVNTGNTGTATVTCYGVDRKLADQIGQLVAAAKRDGKTLSNISDKIDQILKTVQTQAGTGSINQTNSGGVSIQQGTTGPNSPIIGSPITIGDIPKNISREDMKALVAYLSKCANKATIKVAADQISGLAPFPDQYYDALKNAGWTMPEAGVSHYMGFSAPGKRFQGAILRVKGEPLKEQEQASFSPSDPMACIGRSLEAFNILRSLSRNQNEPDGVITVDFSGGFPR